MSKPNVTQQLIDLGRTLPLFHDPDGIAYATVAVVDHQETWALSSKGFKGWFAARFWDQTGKPLRSQTLADALLTLEGLARFEGPEAIVHVRLAHVDGAIFLDLGDPRWQAVVIDQHGWRLVPDPPVKFRRPKGMAPMPEPVSGGDIERLRPLINLADRDDDWHLLIGWLIGAFSRGPYPVLTLNGEQGSAKTTTSRLLRSLIDPNTSPDRATPRDDRDLVIAASNGHVVAYDNLSGLREWQSDSLARLATGAGFGTRLLYTDADEMLFFAARPIIINGIGDLAVRSDLLDRSLLVTLPRIDDAHRKTEQQLWADFETMRPHILGALLDAVSTAIAGHATVAMPTLPRMADFARWVTAAEPALGWPDHTFLRAYGRNRSSAHDLALDAASIVAPLKRLPASWTGTASELLEDLTELAGERVTRRPDWPSAPNVLAGQLRRLAPDLRAIGIEVEFDRKHGRRVTITRAEPVHETDTTDTTDT